MTSTILVIEDERTTRTSITQFLQSEGFQVLDADNGSDGIRLANTHLPDLIICDIMMPEVDGYEVLIELQSSPDTAVIPFVFLTATSEQDGFRHGMEMGADDYLSKPITSESLLSAIRSRLKKRQQTALSDGSEVKSVETVQKLQSEIEQYQNYSDIKDRLLERVLDHLKEILPELYRNFNSGLATSTQTSSSEEYAKALIKAMSLVNEAYEFNRTLKPENAQTLKNFPFLSSS